MKKSEQKKLLKEICNRVRDTLLSHADKWPEEWDGRDLRELAAYAFRTNANDKKRSKDVTNEIIVRNLY